MDEALGHLGVFHPEDRGARGENEIEARRDEVLVLAVKGAEATFGPVPVYGVAHGSPGGDDPDAGGGGRLPGRSGAPGKHEGAAVHAAALLTDGANVQVINASMAEFNACIRNFGEGLGRFSVVERAAVR